jgi:Rod binding domain-containing protein
VTLPTVNPLAASPVNASALPARPEGARATVSKAAVVKSGGASQDEGAKLKAAADQFEAVFVRQLLKASRFGEDMGEAGYGGMALEALADGVTKQGGLGLARAIEDALRGSSMRERAKRGGAP